MKKCFCVQTLLGFDPLQVNNKLDEILLPRQFFFVQNKTENPVQSIFCLNKTNCDAAAHILFKHQFEVLFKHFGLQLKAKKQLTIIHFLPFHA
jgi:hypothetical protein